MCTKFHSVCCLFHAESCCLSNHKNHFVVLNCQVVEWVGIFANPVFKNPGIYQFDYSVVGFPIKNSSNKSTISTCCFVFLFDISKITKINETFLKKATLGISREIWWKSFRLLGKPGELAGIWIRVDCEQSTACIINVWIDMDLCTEYLSQTHKMVYPWCIEEKSVIFTMPSRVTSNKQTQTSKYNRTRKINK